MPRGERFREEFHILSVSVTFGSAGSLLLHVGFSLFAGSRGSSLVMLRGFHIVVASLIAEHGP